MDLLGSESRKTGTRGGRANFSWDAVRDDEKHYYLGNSIANPSRDSAWYARHPTSSSAVPVEPDRGAKTDSCVPPLTTTGATPAATTLKTGAVADGMNMTFARGKECGEAAAVDDLKAVRQREKAIMERMMVGRSFADAVRSALTESVGSGVDDDCGEQDISLAASAARRAARKREVLERAERKEKRRRVREVRVVRRAARAAKRGGLGSGGAGMGAAIGGGAVAAAAAAAAAAETVEGGGESSESCREDDDGKSRALKEGRRRRRRRERDSATRRKRSEWSSTSDSDDFDRHRSRRRVR